MTRQTDKQQQRQRCSENDWTEKRGRKTLKDCQKSWRMIAQDHLRQLQESLAPGKQIMKKSGMTRDFCTMLHIT